ncbi:unnamed protein product [Amoebophrya sp. A25]|nr:unnamed protein product [Amoebophrya sp. A25]|eukprot:GSA25T00002676001.1
MGDDPLSLLRAAKPPPPKAAAAEAPKRAPLFSDSLFDLDDVLGGSAGTAAPSVAAPASSAGGTKQGTNFGNNNSNSLFGNVAPSAAGAGATNGGFNPAARDPLFDFDAGFVGSTGPETSGSQSSKEASSTAASRAPLFGGLVPATSSTPSGPSSAAKGSLFGGPTSTTGANTNIAPLVSANSGGPPMLGDDAFGRGGATATGGFGSLFDLGPGITATASTTSTRPASTSSTNLQRQPPGAPHLGGRLPLPQAAPSSSNMNNNKPEDPVRPLPPPPIDTSNDLDAFSFLDPSPRDGILGAWGSAGQGTQAGQASSGGVLGAGRGSAGGANPLFSAAAAPLPSASFAGPAAAAGSAGSATTAAMANNSRSGGVAGLAASGKKHKYSSGMLGGLSSLASSVMKQGEKMLQQAASASAPENEFGGGFTAAGSGSTFDAAATGESINNVLNSASAAYNSYVNTSGSGSPPAQLVGGGAADNGFFGVPLGGSPDAGGVTKIDPAMAMSGTLEILSPEGAELPSVYSFWEPGSSRRNTGFGDNTSTVSLASSMAEVLTDAFPLDKMLPGESVLFEVPRAGALPQMNRVPENCVRLVIPNVFPRSCVCKKLTVSNYRMFFQLSVDRDLVFSGLSPERQMELLDGLDGQGRGSSPSTMGQSNFRDSRSREALSSVASSEEFLDFKDGALSSASSAVTENSIPQEQGGPTDEAGDRALSHHLKSSTDAKNADGTTLKRPLANAGATSSSTKGAKASASSALYPPYSLAAWLKDSDFLCVPWGSVLSIKQYDQSGYRELLKELGLSFGGGSGGATIAAATSNYAYGSRSQLSGDCWKVVTKDLRVFYLEDVPPNFGTQLQEAFRKFANAAYGPGSLFAFAHKNGELANTSSAEPTGSSSGVVGEGGGDTPGAAANLTGGFDLLNGSGSVQCSSGSSGSNPSTTADAGNAVRDGWLLYDPFAEYSRQGIDMDTEMTAKSPSPWRLSLANKSYQLCESYPQWLVVPKRVTDAVLHNVGSYRKKHRIPALSWCGGREIDYACVFRSSQPCDGLFGNQSDADEYLLKSIASRGGEMQQPLFVLDLRTHKSALGNKAGGGGYEDYPFCQLEFAGIPNIHAVRGSFEGMEKAVARIAYNQSGNWFAEVGNSLWFENLSLVLQAAANVAWKLRQKRACLVHCSDGWDRTAQNTTLAMLALDPYYRTLEGFCVLIQKEWVSFGHQFKTRLATSMKAGGEYSPVFFQWLDAVYQVAVCQYPDAFEFNERLLLDLGSFVVDNRFGTFLADNERESVTCYATRTESVWSYILRRRDLYAKCGGGDTKRRSSFLPIVFSQARLKLWHGFWFRYHPHLWAVT